MTVKFEKLTIENQVNKESVAVQKEKAIAAVIATNAYITPEQFQALTQALGQEVLIECHFRKVYPDKDTPTEYTTIEKFILKDVNFVEDPNTSYKYLAFLRSREDVTSFPYWCTQNVFGDLTYLKINSVKLASGEELWHFDKPGARFEIDRLAPENIVQLIKDNTQSMLARLA